MSDHYWRLRTYAPYFDSRLSWFGGAWAYYDAYAIYRGSSLAGQHPGLDLEGRAGPQPLHPLRLQRDELLPERGRHRQPGVAAPLHRQRQGPDRRGLQGHLRRRRQLRLQRLRRGGQPRRPDRPAHRPADGLRDLAALPRRVHGTAPSRAAAGRRDRPEPGLLPRRPGEPVRAPRDRRRHAHRDRARRQRLGHLRRRRRVRLRDPPGLDRLRPLERQGRGLRRPGRLGPRVRALGLLPELERPGRDRDGQRRRAG